ncbi:MAG: UPF0104 family protein, partial [Caldilineae bacterium]
MTERWKRWIEQNRRRLVPAALLAALALFFGWRAATLGDWVHVALAGLYGALAIAAMTGLLRGGPRSNALNLGISLFFLDLVFAQLNLREVGAALASARWWMLLPSLAALGGHLVFRIWRWQWLLKPIGEVPFWPAFRAAVIGIGGNMVLPARAGEFLRAYVIGRSQRISKTAAFATLVVERIFDGLAMIFILLGLVLFGVRDAQMQRIGLVGTAFYLLALAGVVVFIARREWFERLVHRLLPGSLADRVLGLMQAFASGLESLRDGRQLTMVTLLTALTWVFIPLSFWPVLLAFEFHVPVPFFAAVLMLPMVAFGLTVPGAPAGVG